MLPECIMARPEGDPSARFVATSRWVFGPLVSAALAIGASITAAAAPLPHANNVLVYSVVDQDLRDVLSGIGNSIGLRVNIGAGVHGRVHGRLAPATAKELLDRLGQLYGFDWYCDGTTLYVSPDTESSSKVLAIGAVDPALFVQTLNELGITDSRWPVRITHDSDVVMVGGPPRYLGLIDEALAALAKRGAAKIEVRVFRGEAKSPF